MTAKEVSDSKTKPKEINQPVFFGDIQHTILDIYK
jgi:hypothetical protein